MGSPDPSPPSFNSFSRSVSINLTGEPKLSFTSIISHLSTNGHATNLIEAINQIDVAILSLDGDQDVLVKLKGIGAKPVFLVTASGQYRTGKSTLLNNIIQVFNGSLNLNEQLPTKRILAHLSESSLFVSNGGDRSVTDGINIAGNIFCINVTNSMTAVPDSCERQNESNWYL